MIQIIRKISLETYKPNLFKIVAAKQGDSNSRFLKATIVNDGRKIDIPLTATATIGAKRSDGESASFACVVNDDGTVTVPLTYWMLEINGVVECDVSIVGSENTRLTTSKFFVEVEETSCPDGEITEDDDCSILVKLIEDVKELQDGLSEELFYVSGKYEERTVLNMTQTFDAIYEAFTEKKKIIFELKTTETLAAYLNLCWASSSSLVFSGLYTVPDIEEVYTVFVILRSHMSPRVFFRLGVGEPGEKGEKGEKGADGYSPLVDVYSIDGGHLIEITDVNGTKSFSVMDGKTVSGDGAVKELYQFFGLINTADLTFTTDTSIEELGVEVGDNGKLPVLIAQIDAESLGVYLSLSYCDNNIVAFEGTAKLNGKQYLVSVEMGLNGTNNVTLTEILPQSSGGGVSFETDDTLTLKNGILSVNTTDTVAKNNTLPITSAAVAVTVGNIEVLLNTI